MNKTLSQVKSYFGLSDLVIDWTKVLEATVVLGGVLRALTVLFSLAHALG